MPTHEYVVPRSMPITVPISKRRLYEVNSYFESRVRLPFLLSSAARESVNAMLAIINRLVKRFMFANRKNLLMNESG